MKQILTNSILILCLSFLYVSLTQAQTSKNSPRLRSLRNSIERAESQIVTAENQMLKGDSLIRHGDRQIADADKDFYRIAGEVKKYNKEYQAKRKMFDKLCKSKDREIAIKARADIRKLEEDRRIDIRNYSLEVREMKKLVMLGESDIRKGQQLQKIASRNLKLSEKALHDAQHQYDMAISTFGK